MKTHRNETIYIRKQTALWLLQETERVSSDRIFRVRAKQPHDGSQSIKVNQISNSTGDEVQQAEYILIGDLCVFKLTNATEPETAFEIGRVLQIIKYDKNGKKPL